MRISPTGMGRKCRENVTLFRRNTSLCWVPKENEIEDSFAICTYCMFFLDIFQIENQEMSFISESTRNIKQTEILYFGFFTIGKHKNIEKIEERGNK